MEKVRVPAWVPVLVLVPVPAPSHSLAPRCCLSRHHKQLSTRPRRTTTRRAAAQVWKRISSQSYSLGLFSFTISQMISLFHTPLPLPSVSAEKQLMPDTGSVTNRNSPQDSLRTGSALNDGNGKAADQRATSKPPIEAVLKFGHRHVTEEPLEE
jgi:hypothetical protein